jgi:endonuclease/exonuclease/phosphatase family metal-dependent hydrolase
MQLPRNAIWFILVLIFGTGATPPAGAAEVSLRTMSFNVRYAGTVDDQLSGNGWFNSDPSASRAQKAVQVIRDYGPDILGTQEALSFQLQSLPGQDLASGLADYGYYGVGRENGIAQGEYAAIFYRSDRFTRVDAGTFWLSPTPDVPSIYPGAGTIRIASWVKLDDHLSGQQIFVLNTHLDNVSNTANVYSANLIRDRLPGLAGDAPIVLTGDMNSTETSSVVRTLLGLNDPGEFQLGDAFREVHPTVGSNERTYHAYSGGTSGSRIDFILHSDALTPTGAAIVRTTYGGRYPSDHYPVTAEFTLAVVPEPTGVALLVVGGVLLLVARKVRR